jgi:hypothetical protein
VRRAATLFKAARWIGSTMRYARAEHGDRRCRLVERADSLRFRWISATFRMDSRCCVDQGSRLPGRSAEMRQEVAYALILVMVLGAAFALWRRRAQRRRRPHQVRIDLTGKERD